MPISRRSLRSCVCCSYTCCRSMRKISCANALFDIIDTEFREIPFLADTVCHHMDMRMMSLIVKCGIPPEILLWYPHCLCNQAGFGAANGTPALRIVIGKTLRVLPVHGKHHRPDISPHQWPPPFRRLQFIPSSRHWCFCQRTLGGAKRSRYDIEVFSAEVI